MNSLVQFNDCMFLGPNSWTLTTIRHVFPGAHGNSAQRVFSLALCGEGVVWRGRDLIGVVLEGPGAVNFDLDCSDPVKSVCTGELGVDLSKELINNQELWACISLANRAAPVIDHRCLAGCGIPRSYKSVTVKALMVAAVE